MINDKVKNRPIICKLFLAFSGNIEPSIIETHQPFADESDLTIPFEDTYFSKGSISYRERSTWTAAGEKYTQTIEWQFASNDDKRSERIAKIKQLKFLQIQLSDGRKMTIGRNDYGQNTKPRPVANSDLITSSIEMKFETIFPLGFTYEN